MDKNFEEALNSFDFHKVQRVMEFLDWQWATDSGLQVPTVLEMRATVISLYESTKKVSSWGRNTGCCSIWGI